MAVRDGNVRVTVTMPRDLHRVIQEEAKSMGLTVSGYVAMTMRANSFAGDEKSAEYANLQLQKLRDRAWLR